MKLADLEPRWSQSVMLNYSGVGQSNFAPKDFYNAITFLCPHCVANGSRSQRLGVAFDPPIGPTDWITPGQPVIEPGTNVWLRQAGVTFDTLTLSPSIDVGNGRIDFDGHWHGFIRNGEIL